MDQPTTITLGAHKNLHDLYSAKSKAGLITPDQQDEKINETAISITTDDLRQHAYIIGGTGAGKTTLLKNILIQLIQGEEGLTFVDIKGDDAKDLLDFVPPHRVQDVTFFDASDIKHPLSFNVLAGIDPLWRPTVASNLVEEFKSMFGNSWGPRLEDILYNSLAALLDFPQGSLLGIPKLLTDPEFRTRVVSHVRDPVVSDFWNVEFKAYHDKYRTEAIGPVLNKVRKFISSPYIRNVLCQEKNSFDPKFIMDSGKILICRFPKGLLGVQHAKLLGALVSSHLIYSAMTRLQIPAQNRVQHHLCIDEFQNFGQTAFDEAFSELRTMGLSLICAHQYLGQTSLELQSSIAANVQTRFFLRVDPADAKKLSIQTNNVAEALFCDMPNFQAWARLPNRGDDGTPDEFMIKLLPPLEQFRQGYAQSIINDSRTRFGRDRADVEAKITRFLRSGGRNYSRPKSRV